MKYIIIEIQEMEVPILFPEFVQHESIWNRMDRPKVVSAGFCTSTFDCYGESISLCIKSRKDDSLIIKNFMRDFHI